MKNKKLFNICFFLLAFLAIFFLLNPIQAHARIDEGFIGGGNPKPPSNVVIKPSTTSYLKQTASDKSQTIGIDKTKAFSSDYTVTTLFNMLYERAHYVVAGISGIVAMTLILILMKQFTLLGMYADNAQKRAGVLGGIMWTFIAIALSGSITLFMSLFYNMF